MGRSEANDQTTTTQHYEDNHIGACTVEYLEQKWKEAQEALQKAALHYAAARLDGICGSFAMNQLEAAARRFTVIDEELHVALKARDAREVTP